MIVFLPSEKVSYGKVIIAVRSFINIRNRSGLKTLPCRMPLVMVRYSDFDPHIVNHCFVFERNSFTQQDLFQLNIS